MTKITIEQFRMLSENEKHLCLFRNSTELAGKTIGIIEYKLYAVNDFFVEFQYMAGCNDVKIRAFKSIKSLDIYLNDIDLRLPA